MGCRFGKWITQVARQKGVPGPRSFTQGVEVQAAEFYAGRGALRFSREVSFGTFLAGYS